MAMASLLKRLGKKADIYNYEPVSSQYDFLPGINKVKHAHKLERHFDAAFIFECGEPARMGNIIDLKKQAGIVVNVDHHLKNSFFGDINWVNPASSSNAEQLFYLFEKMRMPITRDEATCLYTGVLTDTGRFHHSNTNPETMHIAGQLLQRGINANYLCERLYSTRSHSALKLLGLCLSKMEFTQDRKVSMVKISVNDFKSVKSSEDETEEIVNYGLQVPETLISIFARQTEQNGVVKVSLRSRRGVNVCELAEKFGGGGHKYASGCKFHDTLDSAARKVFATAKQFV